MSQLPKVYDELYFDFYGKVLGGAQKQEIRSRRVVHACIALLPEPTGLLFVDHYFDSQAKATITELVDNIKLALKDRILRLDWMSETTKGYALEKLDTFLPLLGYPDTWRNYSGLVIDNVYVHNVLATKAYEWQYDMYRSTAVVDRKEWLMSPAMVNAYYWPNTNGITFPAGILQPPLFDARGDFAANYGAIGVVIGHEITHGFDDKGALFDKIGKLKSWWQPKDWHAFERRSQKLAKQYSQYEIEGRKLNGELTLGENIADLGGTLIAFDAMSRTIQNSHLNGMIDGFTPEQRFFISLARIWRESMRPELTLNLLVSNPHAPSKLRVNGVVPNVDAFYDAFPVAQTDKMYKSPHNRVKIW